MDPQTVFCPNADCVARGQLGKGNIGIHSQKEQRYLCRACGKTFAASKGTVFYRLRHTPEVVTLVVTLLAHGCPLQAIVVAFGVDERTVSSWLHRAGMHCQAVHQHLVEQPRPLGQVQADEIRVKCQGGVVWMALALMVSTRLWIAGEISPQRNLALITALMQRVRTCAVCCTTLFCSDGLSAYKNAIGKVFRERVLSGRAGRPRLKSWPGLLMAQVVKERVQGRVVGVTSRIVRGTAQQVAAAVKLTQGGGTINTAYIERLNATFRARLAVLVRRGRALARQAQTLRRAMYVMGTVYNFCTYHASLSVWNGQDQIPQTPAMATGITNHCWSVRELLNYHVPLPPWTPPKRRGRLSRHIQLQMARWCS
jgi:hypothetical protein